MGKRKKFFSVGFEYSLAWPIHYVGAAILCFATKPMLKPIDELFFHAIGGMLALHHAHLTTLTMFEDATSLVGLQGIQGLTGRQELPEPRVTLGYKVLLD